MDHRLLAGVDFPCRVWWDSVSGHAISDEKRPKALGASDLSRSNFREGDASKDNTDHHGDRVCRDIGCLRARSSLRVVSDSAVSTDRR